LYAEDRLPDPDMAVALQRLAPADAEILRLWAWEGLEPQEIATVLDTSPGAARTRLSRAKARLREHFESGQEVGS
jgi:RNA polymerase sigma-70 factor (ECF subfamily)